VGAKEEPKIRFALSRGFAVGGFAMGSVYPGRRSQTRLPWAIIGRPYRAFSLLLRRQLGIARADGLYEKSYSTLDSDKSDFVFYPRHLRGGHDYN
jgi:hypothetical protein